MKDGLKEEKILFINNQNSVKCHSDKKQKKNRFNKTKWKDIFNWVLNMISNMKMIKFILLILSLILIPNYIIF